MHPKSVSLFLVAAMAVGYSAIETASASSKIIEPIRTKMSSAIFLSRHGEKITTIQSGLNQIDPPRLYHCDSPRGCLVSFSSEVVTSGFNVTIGSCGTVDSTNANPTCAADSSQPTVVSRQIQLMTPGLHKLQTELNVAPGYTSGSIVGWETDYTIFELR